MVEKSRNIARTSSLFITTSSSSRTPPPWNAGRRLVRNISMGSMNRGVRLLDH
jgi:hypothetical protein